MELEDPARESSQEIPVPTEPTPPSEFEKLFKICEDSPEDFNAWVSVLQYVEQEVSKTYLKYSNSPLPCLYVCLRFSFRSRIVIFFHCVSFAESSSPCKEIV